MAMKDRALIAAGAVAVIGAVCCAAPVAVTAATAVGLIAWLARTGNVLIPAMIFCAGLIGWIRPVSRATSGTVEDG